MRVVRAVTIFLSLGGINSAIAACLPITTQQVVEIRVDRCESAESFAKVDQSCRRVPWLESMQERIVARNRGTVISGMIAQAWEVTWFGPESFAVGPAIPADISGTWFTELFGESGNRLSCAELKTGAKLRLMKSQPCCDVIPPSDYPCWFGIDALHRVPDRIEAEISGRY